MDVEVDQYCFVCGLENPEGLKAAFQSADGKATGRVSLRPEHQGYAGISHGGVVSALLDEAMVYAAVTLGRWATTAELTVRFSKPVPTGEALVLAAEVTGHRSRLVECRAELRDSAGALLATATGKLMQSRALRPGEERG